MDIQDTLKSILNTIISNGLSYDEASLVLESAQSTIDAAMGGICLNDVVSEVEIEEPSDVVLN